MTEEEQRSLELWQSYPNYKRPIVPSEFIDAFLAPAKELGLDEVRIDGQLNPFYPEFKCRVTLIKRKTYGGGTQYDEHTAAFRLEHMPGCGGILISHDSYVGYQERGKGIGTFMQEMKSWIAGKLEAGMLLATVRVGNEAEEGLLEKHGWQKVGPAFRNVHTENMVQMWQRILG